MHETVKTLLRCTVTSGCNPANRSEPVEQVTLALCLTKPPVLQASLQVFHSVAGVWGNSTYHFPFFIL